MNDSSKFNNQPSTGISARRLAIAAAIVATILLVMGMVGLTSFKPCGLTLLIAFALDVMSIKKLQGFSFTAWVFACAGTAIFYPHAFIEWGGFKLELLIIPLTQLIMFGMGTTLSLEDFARVTRSPWPVFIGMALQFSVMPVVGFIIARSMGFDGEIAAGIVLIGSCSGGVASNLMVYLRPWQRSTIGHHDLRFYDAGATGHTLAHGFFWQVPLYRLIQYR